uniref:Uncharacterized mitochondrial protein AtMg00810-like n=1 Tax=Tanacetum cinerariifolium TaxID=118510 RepID=A0A6L2M9G6_TANCI|nr:uncharacterized mitochondrial protein AtMg00810-like [Tanacetum cinerariifolium]
MHETQQAAVQNSNSFAQQDALILSVIEQLKPKKLIAQRLIWTISVNGTLTAELERYKEQVKVLKKRQNVENSLDPSPSCTPTRVEVLEELPKSQEKDTVITKLKERIKSLSGNVNEDKVKKDIDEIETINIEFDYRVPKLIAENEHLKQTYKQLYDSIKPTRVRSKEQSLKDELRKLKGKALVDNGVTTHTISPKMLKIDVELIAHRLLNNRTAHSDYLRLTQEQAAILREVIEQGKSQNPLNNSLDSVLVPNHPPLTLVDQQATKVIASIARVVAPEPATSTSSPSSTTVDQDAPSPSNSQTLPETQSLVISNIIEEENHDLDVAHMNNNPFFGISILENDSESSSSNVIPTVVHTAAPNSEHTYKDALTQSCWIEAMQKELNKFEHLEVWELVPRPNKVMVITLKWIYKVKHYEVGGILKNTARLVSRGYHQEEGIDFEESFAPDFSKGTVDPTLFIKRQDKDILLVQIYVDDIIFASTTPELCDQFSKIMCSKFKMSMMGKISFFLGLQIFKSPRGIFLNQSKYAHESLKKYDMESSDHVDTLVVEKSKLDEDPQEKAVNPTYYHGMVGTLMYLTASGQDLTFSICMCAWYQAKPTEKHLHAVKRIFKYIRGYVIRVWYPKDSSIALIAYADTDHAGSQDTRRSTYGSMQLLGYILVSWSSKRQKSAAISSTKAAYIALSGCCAQVLWMRSQLTD